MPCCEVAIISTPSLHLYYKDILFPNNCCLFDIELFENSPQPPGELAVIDCGNSHEKGISLLFELKKRYSDIPVIFITFVGSEDIVRKVYRSGARDYFKHPFNETEFKEVVESLLEFKLGNRERRNPHLRHHSIKRKLPERLLRAIDFIEQEYETRDIYLEQVAAEACLSKYHFIRLFKEHFDMTPMQYVTVKRVEKAKSILSSSLVTISHAAYQSGFNDVAEFNRQFKKITGITPSEFRSNPQAYELTSHA